MNQPTTIGRKGDVYDIVRIARAFYQNHPPVAEPDSGETIDLSLDWLASAIADEYSGRTERRIFIEIEHVDLSKLENPEEPSAKVLAMLVPTENGFKVVVDTSEDNYCKSKFLAAKELFHVLWELSLPQEIKTLEKLAVVVSLLTYDDQWLAASPSTLIKSETLAKHGAVELLMPWEWRNKYATLERYNGADIERIAHFCRVPISVAQYRLDSRNTAIFDMANELWDLMHENK